MKVEGPAYSHHYATQPLELVVKTRMAKEQEMETVVKIRNRTERLSALRKELDQQALTYSREGKQSKPSPTTGKVVDITI